MKAIFKKAEKMGRSMKKNSGKKLSSKVAEIDKNKKKRFSSDNSNIYRF